MSDHHFKTKQHLSGVLALILVTILWGSTFVVVKETVKTIPASVLILSRFGLSALVLATDLGTGTGKGARSRRYLYSRTSLGFSICLLGDQRKVRHSGNNRGWINYWSDSDQSVSPLSSGLKPGIEEPYF